MVGFDTGEVQTRAIIDALQSLVLLFLGYDLEHGGTTNFLLVAVRDSCSDCVCIHT